MEIHYSDECPIHFPFYSQATAQVLRPMLCVCVCVCQSEVCMFTSVVNDAQHKCITSFWIVLQEKNVTGFIMKNKKIQLFSSNNKCIQLANLSKGPIKSQYDDYRVTLKFRARINKDS